MRSTIFINTLLCAVAFQVIPALAQTLELPIDCRLGEDCFVQQFPDMDPGQAAVDPFCGVASYDGHTGTDIRVRSLADLDRDVAVLAAADGTVVNVRDGEPDRLISDAQARETVRGKECGNAVSLSHEGGLQTLYCHMERGSILVRPGQKVRTGDRLGSVGASGLAQFPHVHLGVRRDGKDIDPMTGRALDEGCDAAQDGTASLFSEGLRAELGNNDVQILDFGLSGAPLDYDSLVVDGAPARPDTTSPGVAGWVWVINFRPGDILQVRIIDPDGKVLSEGSSTPQERHKAVYSYFTGREGKPAPGDYRIEVTILRDGAVLQSRDKTITIS